MTGKQRRRGRLLKAAAAALTVLGSVLLVLHLRHAAYDDAAGPAAVAAATPLPSGAPLSLRSDGPVAPDAGWTVAAETARLRLAVDPHSGHFQVTDKRSGRSWLSAPDPGGWSADGLSPQWAANLRSPLMIRYVEWSLRKDQTVETNLLSAQGEVGDFRLVDGGFHIDFLFPRLGFSIPVTVSIEDDAVQTRIEEQGLLDGSSNLAADGRPAPARLASVRLYPFFGAQVSAEANGEEGYLLVPDGPGGLIRFKTKREVKSGLYSQPIYGEDAALGSAAAVSAAAADRSPVAMPVFGLKSGSLAYVAEIQDGAEYANIVAAPSGTYSPYNWAAAEFLYRPKYYQPTNTQKTEGYYVYGDQRLTGDRSVRYYLLQDAAATYSGMAARYRQALRDRQSLHAIAADERPLPLNLNLLGGDRENGFIVDGYRKLTTTEQAKRIVGELQSMGVQNMSIVYKGWQNGGFSKYGNPFPVSDELGGDEGMRDLAAYAHARDFPLYLDGGMLALNNAKRSGFRASRDGLRTMGSTVADYSEQGRDATIVGMNYMRSSFGGLLNKTNALGVDGLRFGYGLGTGLNSDYGGSAPVTRQQALAMQRDLLTAAHSELDGAQSDGGYAYAWPYADFVADTPLDGSYDLIVDETVPFMQIVLHGSIRYAAPDMNAMDDPETGMLKGIEYGAEPSFTISYADSRELLRTVGLKEVYSTGFAAWSNEMVVQYQRYNAALAGVQSSTIVGHRSVADRVYETVYDNGTRIWVNYGDTDYRGGEIAVAGRSFAVKGGTDSVSP
ncbi:DUF5696 domain-containing protein [Cohnella sp. 56]|uniref:DUF5696 domain-containing protein n=1 Tax=Cohnella sp. 56 TaxID=3113722 RepID=UPI0030EAB8DE